MIFRASNPLRNRAPIGLILYGALLWGCTGSAPQEDFDTIVLITIDTLRADHVGAYGYPLPTTPFLDDLAERGIVFENAFSSSSHTSPSHASLFTSLYPEAHGVLKNGSRLPAGVATTLAEALADQRFATAAFTSTRFLREITQGFDHVDTMAETDDGAFRTAHHTTQQAIDWLEGREADARTFVWLHLYDVHRHSEMRGPHRAFLPRFRRYLEQNADAFDEYVDRAHLPRPLPKDIWRSLHYYDAQLAYVDSEIARFFAALDLQKRNDSTLWVITSDHGEGLGNHGHIGHGRFLYGEQLRVPLIVYGSGERWASGRVDHFVRLVDLFPTLAELAGAGDVATVQTLEGVSLVPLLESPSATLPIDHLFAQRRPVDEQRAAMGWEDGLVIAAQSPSEKYIYYETRPDEYFDLRNDPHELNNLAEQNPREAERLRRWLLERYAQMRRERPVGDQEVLPEHLDELRALGYIN